jgi:hypothetical protein
MRDWLDANAPVLGETFAVENLTKLPLPLARHCAARWLMERGAPGAEISSRTCERLMQMCADMASPPRQHFPGGLLVRRKKGILSTTEERR